MNVPDHARTRTAAIAAVAAGNLFEAYNVVILVAMSGWWVRTYFPYHNPSVVLQEISIAVAYFARPLGAILFGAVMDRAGRRPGLRITLALAGIASLALGALPGLERAGIIVPIIVVGARFIQGMTNDAETAGAAAYLFEIAPPRRRGFCIAWLAAGYLLAAALGYLASRFVSTPGDEGWWRLFVLLGAAVLPLALLLRSVVPESDAFQARANRPGVWAALGAVAADWRTVAAGVLLAGLPPLLINLQSYVLPMIARQLGLDPPLLALDLMVAVLAALAGGWLSDRIGLRRILLSVVILALLTVAPAILWLEHGGIGFIAVRIWLALLLGTYASVVLATLAALMPIELRSISMGLALGLAAAVFGGLSGYVTRLFITAHLGPLGGIVLIGSWVGIVCLLSLSVVRRIGDWDAAIAPPPPGAAPPLLAARSPPRADDDPNWRDKLLASLSDTGVDRAEPGSYLAQRIGWGLLAAAIALPASFVSRFVIPQAFRRDPEGEFFAALLWWMFSILVLSRPIVGALKHSWRAGARRADAELQRAGSRRPIFYLRSFDLDKIIGRTTIVELITGRGYANAEQRVARRLRRVGPVIAIGRPGEKLPALGAARFYVSHEKWKDKVADVAKASQLVLWASGTTEGLRWEISHLLEALPPEKLILWAHPHLMRLLPPEREIEWQRFLATLGSVFPQPLPSYLGITRFFHFDQDFRAIAEPSLRALLKAKGLG